MEACEYCLKVCLRISEFDKVLKEIEEQYINCSDDYEMYKGSNRCLIDEFIKEYVIG